MVQVQAAHQGMMIAEAAFQRHRQVRDLGAHPALGQIGQNAGLRRSPSISASIIARPDLVVMLEATESILMPASWRTLPSLCSSEVRDCTTLARYRMTSRAALMSAGGMKLPTQQAALQQVHQPLGVRKAGFAARDVLDMPGVAHQHLRELTVL